MTVPPDSSGPEVGPAPAFIVGIGASAGGLTAFQAFFKAMPADSGMAFVLVQHLDPKYNSTLAAIIGDCTTMPVAKAVDGTVAAPNTVSVIPPDAILKIEGGVLRVARPETATARRSSVDTFLVSLAQDQGDKAIGIILSGFGSDGTIGIAAIKEAGGLTLSEAEFDHHAKIGMPQSAVAGGFVDHVLTVGDMPAALLDYQRFRGGLRALGDPDDLQPEAARQLRAICAIVDSRIGHDFTQYKPSTLIRRIQRRMQALRVNSLGQYALKLQELPEESDHLFREILIGVTRFFRDPAVFAALAETLIPALIGQGNPDVPVRVWIAGCATGEEAYSFAMLFREALHAAGSRRKIVIFATDVDDRAIEVARAGTYSAAIEADISTERLAAHFTRVGETYRIAKPIRDMCLFSTHDLIKDPPFSKLDMVSCRNLLIYFETELQQRVVLTFHYALKPDGVLCLGPSEALALASGFFAPLDKRHRIFRRLDAKASIPRSFPASASHRAPPLQPDAQLAIDDQAAMIMSQFAPAYIVIDGQHEIQRFSGPVAKFLEPVSGGASLNLFRLLHAELRTPARALLRQAVEDQQPVQRQVRLRIGTGNETINLIAEPMTEPGGGQRYLLLAFQELPAPGAAGSDAAIDFDPAAPEPWQTELNLVRQQLQSATEELEAANEELQSSNEEFQSVNEELQSTIEELETSKEELQSTNEELQTVNGELNLRADNLVRTNTDLANLFDSTPIATIFLDHALRIRRFTPAVTNIFNVRDGDEGRLLTDFASRVSVDTLRDDIAGVMQAQTSIEREIESIDGASYYLLRIKPYRNVQNRVDGVIITLVDITVHKTLEVDRDHLAAIVGSSEDAIFSHDLEGTITSWNLGAQKIFGYASADIIGQPMSLLLVKGQLDKWPANLKRLRRGEIIKHADITRYTRDGRELSLSLTISPMCDAKGVIIGASAVARDIADRKLAEERAGMLMAELDHRVRNILAVVSAVVTQTLKSGAGADDMAATIEGRIGAIANAHDLLTAPDGSAGALADIVETELSPYRHLAHIDVSGDPVVLTPRAGLIVALAIHELATNAVKYGALSTESGRLTVAWQVSAGPDAALTIEWLEHSGPPVSSPARRGFGTKLIELSLVRGLKATVDRQFPPTGVQCRITIPFTSDIGAFTVQPHNAMQTT